MNSNYATYQQMEDEMNRFEEEIGLSSSGGQSSRGGQGKRMSFYQQNRNNFRTNSKRSTGENQTGAKRKNPRWLNKAKVRDDDIAFKRDRKNVFDGNFDSDAPLFKTPYLPDRSPNSRSHNYSYDDEVYQYDNQRYNMDDEYSSPSYDQREQRNLASPAHSMYGGQRFAQQRKSTSATRSGRFLDSQHSGPAWQWEKYFNECQNWQDKHKLAYFKSRCMALEFENQMLFEQIKTLIHENGVFASERGEVPSMLLPNFPGGLRGFEGGADSATEVRSHKNKGKHTKTSDDTSANENLVCDVPDTMLAVIEESMRHKLNLYKERKEEAAKEKEAEDEKKKEEELNKHKQGPKEPRGFKRKEELEQLYGGNATLIQSLETSIQHNFNRNCDTYKPEMWMTVPLNPTGAV